MAKYYAVKVSKTPGVYTSWSECEEQVKGFKGAKYKSFNTFSYANEFVGITNNTNINKEIMNCITCELHGIREGVENKDF